MEGAAPGAGELLPILERLSEGVLHLSPQGRVLAANARGCELLGQSDPAALEGRAWQELTRALPLPYRNGPTGGEAEWRSCGESGESLVVRGQLQRLPDGSFLASLRDVTEIRELELQFSQAQKMESLGRLAGGICHDFRNLLTIIHANASLLLGEADDSHPFRGRIREMHLAAQRGGELVAQLMAHIRPSDGEPRPTDLRVVVRDIRPLVDRVVGDDVEVVLEEADEELGVRADPVRLEQVILNLVTNARDAMPRGGRLTLRTEVHRHPAESTPHGASSGETVRLSVGDTGHGMDAPTLDRIFQPFFTTKSAGRGTGLGLPSVLRVVQQCGGRVHAESEPGRGTVFHADLPRVPLVPPAACVNGCTNGRMNGHAGPEARSAPAVEAHPRTSSAPAPRAMQTGPARPPESNASEAPKDRPEPEPATVLVVEDEPAIRTVLRQILERGGLRVLTAGSGEEAIKLAREFQGRLDSLLTDLNLPGMDGTEIGHAVRELHPGVRVTIMSGYGPDAVETELMEGLQADFLQKPFEPHTLVNLVRSLADGERSMPGGPDSPETRIP